MVSRNRTGTSILREFINGLIEDQNILANSNAEIFLDKNPVIDKAVRGKKNFIRIMIQIIIVFLTLVRPWGANSPFFYLIYF
jgi:hypothetical protein